MPAKAVFKFIYKHPLMFLFFEVTLALICLIRITPTCYSTTIMKRLRNTQVTWSPLCITCWILNSRPAFTPHWKKGEFRGGEGGGGLEEGGGEWGSNLSSIQLQKLLLPTITTKIQKFVLRPAACHCRRERERKKRGERVCVCAW